MLGFLDTFDAVAFPTFAMMILFGVCLFVKEKNALVLDEEDEDVHVAFVLLLAHPYPVRKVVAVDAEFCAAENMVDDDVTMMKKWETGVSREKKKEKNPNHLFRVA